MLILLLLLLPYGAGGQSHTATAGFSFPDTLNHKRMAGVAIGQGILYSGAITGLSILYYDKNSRSRFHLFNDNGSWQQLDKCGHTFSAYTMSRIAHLSWRWAGAGKNRSVLLGAMVPFAFQLNLEILDGFSSRWGFSWGDIAANTAGCLLYAGQEFAWNEQRITLKYSFHQTPFAKENPAILGSNLLENMWEDYNGMTFWVSGNLSSFLPANTKFPRWINIAAGYGGEGMAVDPNRFAQYRRFFLSADIDLSRIPVKSRTLQWIFTALNVVKIPFPALEYNTRGKWVVHGLYF